jgi:hypothetical protein
MRMMRRSYPSGARLAFTNAIFARTGRNGGKLSFNPHPHTVRQACGFALANRGYDTRALQAISGTAMSSIRCAKPSCRRPVSIIFGNGCARTFSELLPNSAPKAAAASRSSMLLATFVANLRQGRGGRQPSRRCEAKGEDKPSREGRYLARHLFQAYSPRSSV